ncbi:hypothetical protein JCGZ_16142 [Jatropha curcas]|uniref:Uncharacterized protein n=1 Tax=Jatropha curcas TaxID=180498 RepID=A0A067KGA9_JATCU|nr:hypothetical protein JCGZ_16142 [Jatropha curcas]
MILPLGVSSAGRRTAATDCRSWWPKNRSSSDWSDFHISRLKNSEGAQIHAPFVRSASRLVGISLTFATPLPSMVSSSSRTHCRN